MDNIDSNRDKKPDGARRVAISASDHAADDHAAQVKARRAPYIPPRPSWGYQLPADIPTNPPTWTYAPVDEVLRAQMSRSRGPAAARNPTPNNGPEARASLHLIHVQETLRHREADAANHPLRPPTKLKNGQVKTWVDRDAEDDACRLRVVAELRRQGYNRQAERVEKCGRILGLRHCLDCAHDEEVQTHCNMWHLCPTCCRRRGRRMAAELTAQQAQVPKPPDWAVSKFSMWPKYTYDEENRAQAVLDDDGEPEMINRAGWRWRMLTLPIKTGADHAGAVRLISKYYARLWRVLLCPKLPKEPKYSLWARRACDCEAEEGVRREEVGRHKCGRDNLYPNVAAFRSTEFGSLNGNVHLHVLYYGPWIEQAVLADTWEKITGSRVVDVRQAGNLAEVAKYALKMYAVSAADQVRFWLAVRGKQTTQRYGALRGLRDGPADEWELSCELCGSTRYHYTAVVDGIVSHLHAKGFP